MQKFRDVLSRWERKELSAQEAGEILGMSERQFRRYRRRYEEDGLAGLSDRRLGKASAKRVPVDKITWMYAYTQDGPYDMHVEDLLSQLTADSNAFLTVTTSSWNGSRHTDTKVDDYYARYAREMDPAKRRAIAREFQEYMADKLYFNVISGSPFYMVAQPWVKGYVYNAEFEVHWDDVWLDR